MRPFSSRALLSAVLVLSLVAPAVAKKKIRPDSTPTADPAAPAAEISPAQAANMVLKEEHFDKDPGWEAFNNRLKPDSKDVPVAVQDFGYSQTSFAGGKKGELGGQVWRCTTPAFYAAKIPVKTLTDKLTASGKFAFNSAEGKAGLWFGWFQTGQETGAARPKNALGLDFDFSGGGGRLSVRMSNSTNKFCGTFITPYIPGKFRPAPLAPNTEYDWRLTYDPEANGGNGQIEFTIKSVDMSEEGWKHQREMKAEAEALPANLRAEFGPKVGRPDFDDGKPFVIDLPPGFKQEGATFDHFGLTNAMKEGGHVKIYFDDLTYDGTTEDFSKDPQWEGSGNRMRVAEIIPIGYHDFGYSAGTHFTGGSPGEMGGIFWRLTKAYAYYADRIGPLTMDDPMEAHGKVLLKVATPDSEMCFGWFNSAQKNLPFERVALNRPQRLVGEKRMIPDVMEDGKNCFLGVYLDGPSRLGRCLMPAIVAGNGRKAIFKEVDKTPKLAPEQVFDWSIQYVPPTDTANGSLTVKLGTESVTLAVSPDMKKQGATFDRFGFFPSGGGGMVNIYFDDLRYTAGKK